MVGERTQLREKARDKHTQSRVKRLSVCVAGGNENNRKIERRLLQVGDSKQGQKRAQLGRKDGIAKKTQVSKEITLKQKEGKTHRRPSQ